MSERYVMGIDGGGTSTRAALVDEEGVVHARARGGPSNFQVAGPEGLRKCVHDLARKLLSSSRSPNARVDVLCAGLAGAGRPEDRAEIRKTIGELDLARQILVVTDGQAALEGAHGGQPGLIVVSGTGSLAWGRNAQGEIARAGGWGYRIGDMGSGYEIGRQAIAACLRAVDGMEEDTVLCERICARLNLASIEQAIRWIHREETGPKEVADLAPLVFEAALEEDPVAQRIVKGAARDLGSLVRSVARRLHMNGILRLSMIGGISKQKEQLLPWLRCAAEAEDLRLHVVIPRYPPVIGSAIIALRSLGIEGTSPILRHLDRSIQSVPED